MVRTATITIDICECRWSKVFCGSESEIYAEADDWANEMALKFIDDNDIEDPDEQDLVINEMSYIITWEEDFLTMYAIFEVNDEEQSILGVFASREEAQEIILADCEEWVEYIMMIADPSDVLGHEEWHWAEDYRTLLKDAGETFKIIEVPVFGSEEV